jgi:hypothetical protein
LSWKEPLAVAATLSLAAACLAGAPTAQAHHNRATRICEKGHPGHVYGFQRSRPIKRNDGTRVGRLVLTYRAIGAPRFRNCAVALRTSHHRKARMKVRIGFWPNGPWHRDVGRFRRYAGPVYIGGTYAQDGDRTIEVTGTIGRGWRQGFAQFSDHPES